MLPSHLSIYPGFLIGKGLTLIATSSTICVMCGIEIYLYVASWSYLKTHHHDHIYLCLCFQGFLSICNPVAILEQVDELMDTGELATIPSQVRIFSGV